MDILTLIQLIKKVSKEQFWELMEEHLDEYCHVEKDVPQLEEDGY